MLIEATIGSENHSTSSAWAKLVVDGKRLSYRDADGAKWLTKHGDKHAHWVECFFKVREGAEVSWEAGCNTGPRGVNQQRQKLVFIARPEFEILTTEDLGYPCSLRGRLRLAADIEAIKAQEHEALREQL